MADLQPSVLGSGLAANAAMLEKYRMPYLRAAQDAVTNGQPFPPFEQWAAQQAQLSQQSQPQGAMASIRGLFGI